MIDNKIHIAIRSYKRAGKVSTIKFFPKAWIWIPESQKDEYAKYYEKIIAIPDSEDGNLARKCNSILSNSPCKWTLILDDDLTNLGYWENNIKTFPDCDYLENSVIQMFEIANELGVKIWGINQNSDCKNYSVMRPLNLLCPILGPFVGHLNPVLRYDESVLGKDDYDFWLQNIKEHRKTLRFNKWFYEHDSGKMAGGFVSMRSMDIEKAGVKRMIEKWGNRVFKEGGTAGGASATGKNILNSRITIPINGC
jgi:hypothetical protein